MALSIKELCLEVLWERRCHSKARRQPEKKKAVGYLMEDRRRQSVAFENLAKEMLRYQENGKNLKWVSRNCKNKHVQIGITLQQVAQQARNEIGQQVFEIFW